MKTVKVFLVVLLVTLTGQLPAHAQPTLYGIRNLGRSSGDFALLRIDLTTGSADTLHQIEWLWDLALDRSEGKLYLSAPRELLRSDLDGSNLETIIDRQTFTELFYAHASATPCDQNIALDLAARKIYSSGTGWCHPHLFRANLDGSELEWIADDIAGSSLTIDSAHETMYFTGYVASAGAGVFRANLDGSGIEKLVDLGTWTGREEMEMDVVEGKMYWSDSLAILRANLDGTDVEHIVDFGSPSDGGIITFALDPISRKLYFADGGNKEGRLYRCNLDGTAPETVLAGGFREMELDPEGLSVSTEPKARGPHSSALLPAYPNPFNASTTITYVLPLPSAVRLTLIDLLGREVRVLEAGLRPAGPYAVRFDATGVPSGVYLYRLEADVFTETRRLVVLK